MTFLFVSLVARGRRRGWQVALLEEKGRREGRRRKTKEEERNCLSFSHADADDEDGIGTLFFGILKSRPELAT